MVQVFTSVGADSLNFFTGLNLLPVAIGRYTRVILMYVISYFLHNLDIWTIFFRVKHTKKKKAKRYSQLMNIMIASFTVI